MLKNKFILKTGIGLLICSTVYLSIKIIPNKIYDNNSLTTIEDLVEETNFKLEFKNLNELEYTMQDSTIDIKNTGFNKSFANNNNFDILVNEDGKITSISYISDLSTMDEKDILYLEKLYSFVFDNLSSFIFDKTNEIFKKVQSSEYINSNKSFISENGYTIESINLRKTSEIKITTYYEAKEDTFSAYKISLEILQGNKW